MLEQISNSSSPTKRIMRILFFFLVLVIYAIDTNPPGANDEYIIILVRRAKGGDDESFASLFELYHLPIFRHLYRMVGNQEDASDLLEETFIKAWYRLPHIRDEKHFRGWLYKIATNTALDYKRSKSSRKRGPQPPERLSEDHSNEYGASFENQVEEQELIELTLKQVAPRPRACLLLYQEGFSHEEIAGLMGMKVKSIGTYISIAREQFRKAYNHLKDQQ